MSKKNSMNFFEAHLEKMLLGVAAAVFLWVIATQFLSSPGIETRDGVKPCSEALAEAARLAQEKIRQANLTTAGPGEKLPTYTKELFAPKPLPAIAKVPWFPTSGGKLEIPPLHKYRIPAVPPLKEIKVELTHAQVWVPDPPPAATETGMAALQRNQQLKDVDYVTIEAAVFMGDFRKSYDECFKEVQRPLEFSDPIVACVDMERARLLPDGSWSAWEQAGRITSDPLYHKALPYKQIEGLTQTEFEVRMQQGQDINHQLALLKPPGFTSAKNVAWTSISTRKPDGRTPGRPAAPGAAVARSAAPAPAAPTPAPAAGMDPMTAMMMMMMGGGGTTGGAGAPGAALPGMSYNQSELNQDKVSFWAHDDQVEPGGLYRYRLRLGFFNPIAGKKWVVDEQKQFDSQRILWTEYIAPDQGKVVSIPERTYFFPKVAGGQRVSVDVYHWQEGKWYTQSYPATPGSMIGSVIKRPKAPAAPGVALASTQPEFINIDYRTNTTVIDVIPNSTYQCLRAGSVNKVDTTDLIFVDKEGQTRRLGVDPQTWPDEVSTMYRWIREQMRNQERIDRTSNAGPTGQPTS